MSTVGDDTNKPAYPNNGILLTDRNPRRTWEAAYARDSNHNKCLSYLEKGGSASMYEGGDGKAGLDKDDIYQARGANKPTGLPFVPPEGFDKDGYAISPCTDTVIWPLDQR